MIDYEKLRRAFRLLFNLELTTDDHKAILQLTDCFVESKVSMDSDDVMVQKVEGEHDKPQHKHDCEECHFLGFSGDHDLYYCNKLHPTVIARYGDNGEDYISGFAMAKFNKPLSRALMVCELMGYDVSGKCGIKPHNHHKADS